MQILQFHPILKRALWGGRRLGTVLSKPLGPEPDYAESWDVADLPGDISVVQNGNLHGKTLRELVEQYPEDLLGQQSRTGRFPLLIKYLDATHKLSIQVHPSRAMAARRPEVTTGKAETWVILEAEPGSRVYAGLKPGVDEQILRKAATTPEIVDCLHSYEVQPGDCISLRPGTVHAIGAGLLIAEVQEPNNVTYRLSDWGRINGHGKPRELHLELGLEATNFALGPVDPVTPRLLEQGHEELVRSEHFVLHRHFGPGIWKPHQDNRPHVLMLLAGTGSLPASANESALTRGQTVVLPAVHDDIPIHLSPDAILLDAWVE